MLRPLVERQAAFSYEILNFLPNFGHILRVFSSNRCMLPRCVGACSVPCRRGVKSMRVSQSGGIAPAHGTSADVHPLHRPLPQSAIETATIAPVRVSLFHRLVRLKRSLPILKRPKGAVIGTAQERGMRGSSDLGTLSKVWMSVAKPLY